MIFFCLQKRQDHIKSGVFAPSEHISFLYFITAHPQVAKILITSSSSGSINLFTTMEFIALIVEIKSMVTGELLWSWLNVHVMRVHTRVHQHWEGRNSISMLSWFQGFFWWLLWFLTVIHNELFYVRKIGSVPGNGTHLIWMHQGHTTRT